MKTQLLCLLLLGVCYNLSWSRHIIGGDISYECLGEGNYRFTMKIYRDCSNPNADYFDFNAPIAVYLGDSTPYQFITRIYAPLENPVQSIPAEIENPCLILPPNVCVQEGVYFFEINLPPSDQTYHVVYQRCCRNNTISNIIDPFSSGATYSIEINPTAQSLCNNSPVFNDFPPIVICAGEPLAFDHSATDVDGDQLVYELCSPLLGAGVVGFLEPGDPTSCDGFRPDPPCPPPYENVSFVAPAYSALTPLGGNPAVTIDPNTGLITGTPSIQGQFVVGICVYEFRDGILLSKTRRDFQFNVANCQPTVQAQLEADSLIGNDFFFVNHCGTEIPFFNESFQQQFIESFYWEFDIGNQLEVFQSWDVMVEFEEPGTYEGRLILNPDTDCGDTAFITVNSFPGITADFEFEYDTCVADPVRFTDLSLTTSAGIALWNWEFGDGKISPFQNPQHEYFEPGEWEVTLMVEDTDGCQDQISNLVSYFPVPAILLISPSRFIGCAPGSIFFNNLSFPIDDTYQISWDFGDGGESEAISPTYLYSEPGIYDIELTVTSPIGCTTDTLFEQWIEVQPSPIANFDWSPKVPSNFDEEIQFLDLSEGASSWLWLAGGRPFSSHNNPAWEIRDTGLISVELIVTHPEGCQDTIIQVIDIKPEIQIFFPNAFTPNGDGQNDTFKGTGLLEGMKNYNMKIWNRWGAVVYESSDWQAGWAGDNAPNGVYGYRVELVGPRGEIYQLEGFVTLIK